MRRIFRPWSKKRGTRQAARVFSGVVGEVLFFAALFLFGIFTLTLTLAGSLIREASAGEPNGIGFWIFLVASIVVVVTGGGGLGYRILHVGASSERRAAMARRSGALDLVRRATEGQVPELPYVPRGTELNSSPGMRLAYRFPSTASPVIRVAAAAVLALLWCGVWVVLAAVAVTGIAWGTPRPVLTFLLLPLGAIGVWTARYFLRQLREAAGVGATIVEISHNPLRPGESYRVFVAQFGGLGAAPAARSLVCEEEAIFRQGTDVRTDRHVAIEQVILVIKTSPLTPKRLGSKNSTLKSRFALCIPSKVRTMRFTGKSS